MNRMKWKVMRAFGKLPSSPDIRDMNDAQWIYCYLNILEDQNEEESFWKARLKYMGLFISPKMVEELSKIEARENGQVYTPNNSNNNSDSNTYNNSEFEEELSRVLAGEQFMELPDSGETIGNPDMSLDEFVDFFKDSMEKFPEIQKQIDLNKIVKEQESNDDLDIIEIDD
jgi:hypothetical protein